MGRTPHPERRVPNPSPGGGARRRREYQWAQVRHAAAKAGAGHAVQLVAVLSTLHQLNPTPATVHPSQVALGKLMGRHERTARGQVAALVALGVLVVYAAPPRKLDGRWTRPCNRYRPAVDVARRLIEHGSAQLAPTGNARPHCHPVGCDHDGPAPSSATPAARSGAPPPVVPAAEVSQSLGSNPVGALPPEYLAARADLDRRHLIRRP